MPSKTSNFFILISDMEIIIGRQGNQKMQITDPTVSRKHCKVADNGDGTYTIENLSPLGTKVDGVDIIRTTIKPNSRIQMGQSFSATLVELIGVPQSTPQTQRPSAATQKASPQPPVAKEFSISHLKRVWDEYNDTNIEMAKSSAGPILSEPDLVSLRCVLCLRFSCSVLLDMS